jgi:hypothetical protein
MILIITETNLKICLCLFLFEWLDVQFIGHKFAFGSAGKFEFNFSGIRPKSPTKQPKSPGSIGTNVSGAGADDGSDTELEEDEGDHICFQVC